MGQAQSECVGRVGRVLQHQHCVVQCVAALLDDGLDSACHVGRYHDFVVYQSILLHVAVDEAACDQIAHLHIVRLELPLLGVIERLHVHTAWEEWSAARISDGLQWTLDAVEDVVHNTRSQLHLQRGTSTLHWISDSQTSSLLIALNAGSVASQLDDLAHQLEVAHTHLRTQ